jgi:hypothetical protein
VEAIWKRARPPVPDGRDRPPALRGARPSAFGSPVNSSSAGVDHA